MNRSPAASRKNKAKNKVTNNVVISESSHYAMVCTFCGHGDNSRDLNAVFCLQVPRLALSLPKESNSGFAKNFKGKGSRGDNKCRLESVGTIWNCSQKGEPATRDDQENYSI